ncbi:2,4'-dihydroxyacetophenone dioxygenase family protein [Streptomyces canus]|uniref:2,4'-dihydroxyacetophenone dioxygenase family protein n=1 Tax=Streptomyces canus TaxID=58343 RepID=UPI0033B53DDB
MTETTTLDRYFEHNAKLQDIAIHTAKQEWKPFCPGITFKLLRVSAETGAWTVLFHAEAGSGFDRHLHIGAAEYYMVSGRMDIRGGDSGGGFTAVAGDYGYEANSMLHDWTNFPDETVFFFVCQGPLGFLDENEKITAILDWEGVQAMYDKPAEVAASA